MAEVRRIHAHAIITGLFESDKFVTGELLRILCCSQFASRDLLYARKLFERIPNPNCSAFNHLIRGYSNGNFPFQVLDLFLTMRKRGLLPNELTFPFVFKSCGELSLLELGVQIHGDALKSGIEDNVYVQNTLTHFYASCRKIEEAREVFDTMPMRTIVSWNTILLGYFDNSKPEESIRLISQMRRKGIEPDQTMFVILLSAAAELGSLNFGNWIHAQIVIGNVPINVQLGTALINMYAKCGSLNCASLVFRTMRVKNVWTWSSMILSYAQHGTATEAFKLFTEMKECSVQPNYVTYLGLLCVCSHAGLVEEGRKFFQEMINVHGIKPNMSHYSSMVDILGRNGRLREAYEFIENMPMKPDAVIWRTLLSACQMHSSRNSDGIGEITRKKLLYLEPRRSGNYVILANMYSDIGSWEEAAKVRKLMREEGLKKSAAESCIEVGGLIRRFLSSDDFYPDSERVQLMLKGLNLNMKIDQSTSELLIVL